MQLDFNDKLYHFELEQTLSLKELERFILSLRYLKVNTLLCSAPKLKAGVLEKIDFLIQVCASLIYLLTERQGGMIEYIKSRQNVTIYVGKVVTIQDLYDNVAGLEVPELHFELVGIVSARVNILTLIDDLKYDLQN